MGDNFNSKNNSSETNREFVKFIENFGRKEIYIISGNHEKKGDGKTAIDFLGEVKKSNWHIYTGPGTESFSGVKLDFLPYMLNSELEVETTEEAVRVIMDDLEGGDILFTHHAISGTTFNGIKTESLHEVVLPKEELEQKYKFVVAGHIHTPQLVDNTLITGSLFTSDVGETEKFIYKISVDNVKWDVEKLKVPCREIHKIENPSTEQLLSIPKSAIIKAIITNKTVDIEKLKEELSRFDASLIIEDYPDERIKAHIEDGAFDFNIETLLKLYADEKNVDYPKLLKALNIVNNHA
jgi:DNA repair exonuclease SbcCD nuclease subunit